MEDDWSNTETEHVIKHAHAAQCSRYTALNCIVVLTSRSLLLHLLHFCLAVIRHTSPTGMQVHPVSPIGQPSSPVVPHGLSEEMRVR